ncbi:MAG: lipoprotein insertase outer membrane protein LolB [Woeseia sp.]
MFLTAIKRASASLAVGLLCSACVTQPSSTLPELDSWQTRQQVLGSLRNWGFSGRIAVSDGNDGFNGSLQWQQRRDYFDARVSGPLGAGAVRIAGDARRIEVTDSDDVVTELADAERDLQSIYGWQIPLASLRYWALGIPDPDSAAQTQIAADGTLEELQQAGWTVSIGQYREGAGQLMPRRITAVRGATRVRLVVDRWTFY